MTNLSSSGPSRRTLQLVAFATAAPTLLQLALTFALFVALAASSGRAVTAACPAADGSRQQGPSSSNSQDTNTTTTHDPDRVFTPPTSEGGMSAGNGSGHDSSQESHLLQLSQLHLSNIHQCTLP